jgi:hypothetical protein
MLFLVLMPTLACCATKEEPIWGEVSLGVTKQYVDVLTLEGDH